MPEEITVVIKAEMQPELIRMIEVLREMNALQKEAASLMGKIIDTANVKANDSIKD